MYAFIYLQTSKLLIIFCIICNVASKLGAKRLGKQTFDGPSNPGFQPSYNQYAQPNSVNAEPSFSNYPGSNLNNQFVGYNDMQIPGLFFCFYLV